MAQIPNASRAVIDIRKIEDYCLSPSHPRGRHKARVFRQTLGLGHEDATWLRDALFRGLSEADAVELESDAFGTRWRVDVSVARQGRVAVVRTVWIVRIGETAPRFLTCWVL